MDELAKLIAKLSPEQQQKLREELGKKGATGTPPRSSWFWTPKKRPNARLRVVCFPPGGADASFYNNWWQGMPDDAEMLLVQIPGRGNRIMEEPPITVDEYIQAVAKAFVPFTDKPFMTFGHSFGAVASFEFCREVRRLCGMEAQLMCISEAPYPGARGIKGTDEEMIAMVRRQLPDYDKHSVEVEDYFVPSLMADLGFMRTYVFVEDEPFNCPIVSCWGEEDDFVLQDELSHWNNATTTFFSMERLPGNHLHFHVHQEGIIDFIGRAAKMALEQRPPTGKRT